MKAQGICTPATTCYDGIPIPLAAVPREGSDIVTRREAKMRATPSPIVLANPGEFTHDQLRAAGFKVNGKGKATPTAEERNARMRAAAKRYRDGYTAAQIARELGCSPKTILADLTRAGIARDKRRRPKKGKA